MKAQTLHTIRETIRLTATKGLTQSVRVCPVCRDTRQIGSEQVGTLHMYMVRGGDTKEALWRFFCSSCGMPKGDVG